MKHAKLLVLILAVGCGPTPQEAYKQELETFEVLKAEGLELVERCHDMNHQLQEAKRKGDKESEAKYAKLLAESEAAYNNANARYEVQKARLKEAKENLPTD